MACCEGAKRIKKEHRKLNRARDIKSLKPPPKLASEIAKRTDKTYICVLNNSSIKSPFTLSTSLHSIIQICRALATDYCLRLQRRKPMSL